MVKVVRSRSSPSNLTRVDPPVGPLLPPVRAALQVDDEGGGGVVAKGKSVVVGRLVNYIIDV